jgi:hypothetical protein
MLPRPATNLPEIILLDERYAVVRTHRLSLFQYTGDKQTQLSS